MDYWIPVLGGRLTQKIGAVSVIATALICSSIYRDSDLETTHAPEFKLLLAALIISTAGFALHIENYSLQWLIDASSQIAFIVLLAYFLILIPRNRRITIPPFASTAIDIIVLLTVTAALCEVLTGRANAVYARADGMIVYRASGLLFNPNLFGAWLVFVYFLKWNANLQKAEPAWRHLAVNVLIGLGMFLSGSRGAMIGFIAAAGIVVASNRSFALGKTRNVLLVAVGIVGGTIVGLFLTGSNLYALALRWLDIPMIAFAHLLNAPFMPEFLRAHLTDYTPYLNTLARESANLAISVEGRVSGTLRDNGFLAAYDQGGTFACIGLLLAWSFIIARSAFSPMRCSATLACSRALVVFMTIWALQARSFQVYPIWVLMALGATIAIRNRDGHGSCPSCSEPS